MLERYDSGSRSVSPTDTYCRPRGYKHTVASLPRTARPTHARNKARDCPAEKPHLVVKSARAAMKGGICVTSCPGPGFVDLHHYWAVIKKKRCRHWCHRAQNSTGLVHVRYDMAFVWKKVCVTDWNDLMEFYCHMLRFTYYLIALWEASVFGCVSIAIG